MAYQPIEPDDVSPLQNVKEELLNPLFPLDSEWKAGQKALSSNVSVALTTRHYFPAYLLSQHS